MASIDKLTLQIGVDGKVAVKEIGKVTSGLEGLQSRATQAGKKAGKSMSGMGSSIRGMVSSVLPKIIVLTSAFAGLSAIMDLGKESQSLGQLSDKLGVSTEKLSAMGQVIEDMGGSKDALYGTLSALQASFTQFQQFGEGSLRDASVKYGLSISGDADTQLLNIANRMQSMSRGQQADMASMLGIDDQTLALLREGRGEMEKMIASKSDGLLSKEDAKTGKELNIAINKLKNSFRSISQTVMSTIVPALSVIVNGVKNVIDFFKKFEGLGTAVLIAIAGVITAVLLPSMIKFAVATIVAFAPFWAIGAVIAGLVLVFQDLWVGFQGGESLIFNIAKGIRGLWKTFVGWLDAVIPKTGILRDIFEGIKSVMGFIADNLLKLGDFMGSIWTGIGESLGIISPSAEKEGSKNTSTNSVVNNVNVNTDSKAPRAMGKAISTEISKGINGQTSSAMGG